MSETTALTGVQKVAVVLMNLEREQAAKLLKEFSEPEAEEITAEIIRLQRVDADTTDQALAEFHDLAVRGRVAARGGHEIAAGLLESSFGAEKAAGVMNRVASSLAGKSFEFLDAAEPAQVASLLDAEMPQTVALVLTHLRPSHASNILAGLPDERRADVAECIAQMTSATPAAIAIVSSTLKSRAASMISPRTAAEVVGGVQPLVDIINRAPVATERAVLEALDARNPELADEVRSRLLTFNDIVRFDDRDVQRVVRGVDIAVLARALRGAPAAVEQKIRENLSERNRELLDGEAGVMGQLRVSQVEEARADLVRAIRELAEEGQITVHRAEGDDFVD
ncbi:flagellar motor switch protein FliG [Agromyces sp. NPDC056379]|uniref:flagellar motor switch protein FliG n=1 Tax=unclassified Agromyces TaxID=2639701 RepID=UPI0035DCB9B7